MDFLKNSHTQLRYPGTVAAAIAAAAIGLVAPGVAQATTAVGDPATLEAARSALAVGGKTTAGVTTRCANAGSPAAEIGVKKLRKAVICLIAEERKRRGRRPLTPNKKLSAIARRHSQVMVSQDCFQSKCRGEKPLQTRIEKSGYPRPGDRYRFGESTGYSQTPLAMVHGKSGWLAYRYHRKNLIGKKYLDLGIGVVQGAPVRDVDDAKHATYTVLVAWRKRPNGR